MFARTVESISCAAPSSTPVDHAENLLEIFLLPAPGHPDNFFDALFLPLRASAVPMRL
jgi:hypothetical protein